MRDDLNKALRVICKMAPEAYALVYGSETYPKIQGTVYFYPLWGGTLVVAEINGLPTGEKPCGERFFGFHIHEGNSCTGTREDPFADTKNHFNPSQCEHPFHSGDLPPLMGNNGYALTIFYTDRFLPEEIIGRTAVIHDMPDDFKSQPSGASGTKIACGVIEINPL